MEHAIKTWSAVCSALNCNLVKNRHFICARKKCNRPISVRKQLSLTQAIRDKLIPTGLALILGMKTRRMYSHKTSRFIYSFSTQNCGYQVRQGCLKDSAHLAQIGVLILISLGEHLRIHLKDHTRYNQGPEILGGPRRVSPRVGKAQLVLCLKVWVNDLLEWDAGIQRLRARRHSRHCL